MTYKPVTHMDVYLDNIVHNYNAVKEHVTPADVFPVVKGNAYGHGAVAVSRALSEAGARLFAVATVEETVELRRAGIKHDILVMSASLPEEIRYLADLGASCFVSDMSRLRQIEALGAPVGFHIKVDSGMGRYGFLPDEAVLVRDEISRMKHARLLGIATHFGIPWEEHPLTELQYARFMQFVETLNPCSSVLLHAAASGIAMRKPEMALSGVRCGAILYGLSRIQSEKPKLLPGMRYVTRIAQTKMLPKGWYVGYGTDCILDAAIHAAIIPVGAIDGLVLPMAKRGYVLVKGARARVLAVSMDSSVIDVTHVESALPGDEVVICGSQADDEITPVELMVDFAQAMFGAYMGQVSFRVPRLYYHRGQCVGKQSVGGAEGVATL